MVTSSRLVRVQTICPKARTSSLRPPSSAGSSTATRACVAGHRHTGGVDRSRQRAGQVAVPFGPAGPGEQMPQLVRDGGCTVDPPDHGDDAVVADQAERLDGAAGRCGGVGGSGAAQRPSWRRHRARGVVGGDAASGQQHGERQRDETTSAHGRLPGSCDPETGAPARVGRRPSPAPRARRHAGPPTPAPDRCRRRRHGCGRLAPGRNGRRSPRGPRRARPDRHRRPR